MNKLEKAIENLRKAHPEPMEPDVSGKRAVIFVIAVYIILVIINCYNTNKVVREATAYVDDANRQLEEEYEYLKEEYQHLQNVQEYFQEYYENTQEYFRKERIFFEKLQTVLTHLTEGSGQ